MQKTPVKSDYINALQSGSENEIDESLTITKLIKELELLNIPVPKDPTNATYIAILKRELDAISSNRSPLPQLNEFYNALKNPIQYLFADKEIFSQDDFKNPSTGDSYLPRTITPEMLFFYSEDAMNYEEREKANSDSGKTLLRRSDMAPIGESIRKSYNWQICTGFVHYLMFKAGYRTDGKVDNSVEIEDIVFTKYDDDE